MSCHVQCTPPSSAVFSGPTRTQCKCIFLPYFPPGCRRCLPCMHSFWLGPDRVWGPVLHRQETVVRVWRVCGVSCSLCLGGYTVSSTFQHHRRLRLDLGSGSRCCHRVFYRTLNSHSVCMTYLSFQLRFFPKYNKKCRKILALCFRVKTGQVVRYFIRCLSSEGLWMRTCRTVCCLELWILVGRLLVWRT